MSKNAVTIKQLKLACSHVNQLTKAGMTQNMAIRHLEFIVDVYASLLIQGAALPYSAKQFKLWSKAAKKAHMAHPNRPFGLHLRVEHGTPRRQLARFVLDGFAKGKLSKKWMDGLCKRKWKIAVITHDEDGRLSKLPRSKIYGSPAKRWEAANIKFSKR
jgi:hypothetical protein